VPKLQISELRILLEYLPHDSFVLCWSAVSHKDRYLQLLDIILFDELVNLQPLIIFSFLPKQLFGLARGNKILYFTDFFAFVEGHQTLPFTIFLNEIAVNLFSFLGGIHSLHGFSELTFILLLLDLLRVFLDWIFHPFLVFFELILLLNKIVLSSNQNDAFIGFLDIHIFEVGIFCKEDLESVDSDVDVAVVDVHMFLELLLEVAPLYQTNNTVFKFYLGMKCSAC